MKILFENARLIDGRLAFLATDGKIISYIGEKRPEGDFDRKINCKGNILMSGLYNLHCHSAMTLFRGYGEDLPLKEWLETRIFPAEDRLTPEKVKYASYLAIAEQIRNGIVSFSDSYFFCDETAKAVIESGIKANLSRSLVSFEKGMRAKGDSRFEEAVALVGEYNGAASGRLKFDMSIHAEYTNVESYIRDVAEYTRDAGLGMQVHLSETEKEHNEAICRHGMTPTEFFADCGVFDSPTVAAHAVWVTDEDIAQLSAKGVTVAHNPTSNLKLASGVMRLSAMERAGVNVTLGTDGVASNNTLDIFKEMHLAALLSKGVERNSLNAPAEKIIKLATENGAKAQGRELCGSLCEGFAADFILVDSESINNIPSYSPAYTVLYSTSARDVLMTVVDGKILYENGEFTTLDIEKIKDGFKRVCDY